MKRMVNWWTARRTNTRAFQDELDTSKALVLAILRNRRQVEPPTDADVDTAMAAVMALPSHMRPARLQLELTQQLEPLMAHVQATGGFNPYPVPRARLNPTWASQKARDKRDEQAGLAGAAQRDLDIVERPIASWDGAHPWAMRVCRSGIAHPAAGLGVRVDGSVAIGTVLCIYPGRVYWPGTLTAALARDSEYIISRYDGVAIDGRDWDAAADDAAVAAATRAMARGTTDAPRLPRQYCNPYGIGQFVNHPPPQTAPNVMAVPFRFAGALETPYVPHVLATVRPLHMYVDERSMTGVPSIVLMAARNLANEELFLNYRFNPANPMPDWYWQPDEEAAERRWARQPLLF